MTENSRYRELEGRRAVVTGSSSGIGRAIALELADAGARLLVHAGKSQERAESVRGEIETLGGEADVVLADLRDANARERLADEADALLGGIDIWINNAGADILTGSGPDLSYEEKLRVLFEVDVEATMLLCRAVGPRIAANEHGGVILNMGWDQAAQGMEGDSGELFGATKGAVMSFSKSLALTLAPKVRVNCLAPGWIRTAWGDTAPAEWHERVLCEVPLKRWGSPEDIARTARFLCSDAASFITGQVININGGAVR